MKNILFILTSFRHGGTNKSLENLLSLIDTEQYQVDVFAMEHFGPYKEMLPNCTILPEDKWLSALIAHFGDTKGFSQIRSFFIKLMRNIGAKLNVNITNKLYKKTATKLLKTKNYDAVIAYSEGVPTAFVSNLNHSNKIAWIHCDYGSYMTHNNHPNERELYATYKSIICVSEYTKGEFVKIMPLMKERTFSMHNLLNTVDIQQKSAIKSNDLRFNNKSFTLISIGTFYPIKRLSKIPDIANELLKRGSIFTWYVIGSTKDTDEYRVFEEKISKYKIHRHVKYLGEKKNPYYYIKNSDLFVSLSTTEACPYVINESKALNIPIVCTDFPSAPEFIENGVFGFIAPINEIADQIEKLINDADLYKKMKANFEKKSYDNEIIMSKFYELIKS